MALGDGIRRNIAHVDPTERALLKDAILQRHRQKEQELSPMFRLPDHGPNLRMNSLARRIKKIPGILI